MGVARLLGPVMCDDAADVILAYCQWDSRVVVETLQVNRSLREYQVDERICAAFEAPGDLEEWRAWFLSDTSVHCCLFSRAQLTQIATLFLDPDVVYAFVRDLRRHLRQAELKACLSDTVMDEELHEELLDAVDSAFSSQS